MLMLSLLICLICLSYFSYFSYLSCFLSNYCSKTQIEFVSNISTALFICTLYRTIKLYDPPHEQIQSLSAKFNHYREYLHVKFSKFSRSNTGHKSREKFQGEIWCFVPSTLNPKKTIHHLHVFKLFKLLSVLIFFATQLSVALAVFPGEQSPGSPSTPGCKTD